MTRRQRRRGKKVGKTPINGPRQKKRWKRGRFGVGVGRFRALWTRVVGNLGRGRRVWSQDRTRHQQDRPGTGKDWRRHKTG